MKLGSRKVSRQAIVEMEAKRFGEFWSFREIGQEFGVSHEMVRLYLPPHDGFAIVRQRHARDRAIISDEDRAVMKLWEDGQAIADISDKLSIGRQTVRRSLDRQKVKREARRKPKRKQYSNEELIEKLRACAAELGYTPSSKKFDSWSGGYKAQVYMLRWGSWVQACEAAGLPPNQRVAGGERTYSTKMIENAYDRITQKLGKQPTHEEWEDLNFVPAAVTLRVRYGSWMEFLQAMEARNA